MEQTEKKQVHYKKIENISAYVQKLAKEGANLIIAKKWTRIMARNFGRSARGMTKNLAKDLAQKTPGQPFHVGVFLLY